MIIAENFSKLFEPGMIGTLELKNRIIMPPMGNRFCGVWGEVTDTLIEWYRRRARGGCGLIIVEGTHSAVAMDPLRPMPRVLRADDTCYIAGLASLAEAIHENGAKAGIQLQVGAGARAVGGPWMPGVQAIQRIEPISPSGVPAPRHTGHPRLLTGDDIERIVELCGIAAWNVKQAGFDMIEMHAHGGYLISQFLSPYFNKRTDKYGGSFDNRCRFLLQIIDSMRKMIGTDFPLTVKYSIDDSLPGSWDIKQSEALAKTLEASGINGIGISSGFQGSKIPFSPPYFYPKGVLLPFAEAIKELVSIPVYVGGRVDDPRLAERALRDGKADFICEGRALIADPDWPYKIASGQTEEIRPCLACNECLHSIFMLRSVRCSVNAAAGREREYDLVKPVEAKKKVLIVGGGAAGMEAARIAALRGHDVVLCERYRQLGGLMLLGGVHNEQISAFADWLVSQIKALPIEIRLQTEVDTTLVEELEPDAVVLANGGRFVKPAIPGINRDNVFSAQDLLNLMNGIPINKGFLFNSFLPLAKKAITASMVRSVLASDFPIKRNVAVIGGQFPGCSLAILLAHKGKKVTLIEESTQVGRDMEANTVAGLDAEIEAGNVKVLTSVRLGEINDKGIILFDGAGNKILHEADTVVVALELAPSDSNLAKELRAKVKEVHKIGDAKSFGRIMKAISEGYATGYNL